MCVRSPKYHEARERAARDALRGQGGRDLDELKRAGRQAHGFSAGDGGGRDAAGGGGSSTPCCVPYTACAPRKVHAANYNSYRMLCNATTAASSHS